MDISHCILYAKNSWKQGEVFESENANWFWSIDMDGIRARKDSSSQL
jgi:hypothetical protein